MIGVYDYTVILTYISLASSICGMFLTFEGNSKYALLCLAFSGLCDMFDGKIARTKKNRTKYQESFGIQIDSLCDVICFGVFPILIAYSLGMDNPVGIAILILFGLTSVIRLAHFNVVAEEYQNENSKHINFYKGLPITSSAIGLPIIYLFKPMLADNFYILMHIGMLIIGILYVTPFKLKKPNNIIISIIVAIVALALANTFIFHLF